MRILLNRKPVYNQAWGGGNLFLQAFCAAAYRRGHEVVHAFDDRLDAIFMHDPRPSDLGIGIDEIAAYVGRNPWVKVIHRVNECDARKGTTGVDRLLKASSVIVSATVFVSEWMKDYHLSAPGPAYAGGQHHVIQNGVDRGSFHPIKTTSDVVRIVAHHWSNNRMKGFDVYEALDGFVAQRGGYEFTYIGRENGTFRNTRIIPPCFGKDLGSRLAVHDVYVSGTRWDPGPNHVLEALACGLPTYVYKDGGGAVEFAGQDHVFSSIDELFGLLLSKQFSQNKLVPNTWDGCMDSYFRVIEGL